MVATDIVTQHITLSGLRPVINGTVLDVQSLSPHGEVIGFSLTPLIDGGSLWVKYEQNQAGDHLLNYWLDMDEVTDEFVLDSFGIQFDSITNVRAFLRNGYFSWDGSYYVPAEEMPVGSKIQGYAMTQLLPLYGTGSVVMGFDRHDRFQQTFTIKRVENGFTLAIETLWDRKTIPDGEQIAGETLILFEQDGVEDALRKWAQRVAEAQFPRLSAPPISGWCSWYNLYGYINEENILEHLNATREVVQREQLPMWVFQIDDGFTPEMGDWLAVKPQFPRGMQPLLDDIRAAGFTPGLWIAPFMVGNRSRLYREHPDWVVKDRSTGEPLAHMKFYAEFRWHKRSEEYYILDTTHPEAFAYLRQVFRTWRHEWGCEYFKTDFMHFGSEYGADRADWHTPGMTRIEIWRRTAQMIREEIGDAVWVGCGCPLWASVGVVDAVRIGRDVGVEWRGDSLSAQSLLRDQATRNFGNGILWQADPDCILLRDHFHNLSDDEVRSLALYAAMSAGLRVTSDQLVDLSPERLSLWKWILSWEKGACRFPLLGQAPLVMSIGDSPKPAIRSLDPVLVQVREPLTDSIPVAMFILNTGEVTLQRTYRLSMLGLQESMVARKWKGMEHVDAGKPIDQLTVTLKPHEGQLWMLSPIP